MRSGNKTHALSLLAAWHSCHPVSQAGTELSEARGAAGWSSRRAVLVTPICSILQAQWDHEPTDSSRPGLRFLGMPGLAPDPNGYLWWSFLLSVRSSVLHIDPPF